MDKQDAGERGQPYVSRGGEKLAAALDAMAVDCRGVLAADLGSHIGGFVDCLLQRGASRVHAIDTCYGTLAWRLRKDPRVVVHERCNALHVVLDEPVDLVTIDVGWTRQHLILPRARLLLRRGGRILTLVKPHYESAPELLAKGVLPQERVDEVVAGCIARMQDLGFQVLGRCASALAGHGGNQEVFVMMGAD